jgi:hypothetical protein
MGSFDDQSVHEFVSRVVGVSCFSGVSVAERWIHSAEHRLSTPSSTSDDKQI